MILRPDLRIDVHPVVGDDLGRRHFLALLARQFAVRHRCQPDVGVEPDLMAPCPVIIGPPRGCAMSPTRKPRPADRRRLLGKPLQELDQPGWPQLRLRDSRITCQVLPLIGSALPPARQPWV